MVTARDQRPGRTVQTVIVFGAILLAISIFKPTFSSADLDADVEIVGFNDHNSNGLPDQYERPPFNQFHYRPYRDSLGARPVCIPSAVAYPSLSYPEDSLEVFVRTNCDTESVHIRLEWMDGRTIFAAPASRWSRSSWTLDLPFPSNVSRGRLMLRIFTRSGKLTKSIKIRDPVETRIIKDLFKPYIHRGDAFPDCNNNYYPDRIDLRDSLVDDVNHNQVIDDCEPDSVRARIAWDGKWPDATPSLGKADLATRYLERHRVRIRYGVGPASAPVRVDVVDLSTGALIRNVVNKRQRHGVYQLLWHCDDSHHRLLEDGTYRVVASIGGLAGSHLVGWYTPSK